MKVVSCKGISYWFGCSVLAGDTNQMSVIPIALPINMNIFLFSVHNWDHQTAHNL